MEPSTTLPGDFLKRMEGLLGAEYAQFLQCYTQPAVNGLRVNTLKVVPDAFKSISPFALQAIPWCASGFQLQSEGIPANLVPGKHPLHAAGVYYLQDPSAMAVAEILAPEPGELVLDLTAAPGGKATHLAALMGNEGQLVTNEIHPQRVWTLAENLERCGVRNAVVLQETPQRLAAHFNAMFDKVLVDAPCSGEGMFRKSAEARQAWSAELVQSCAARQLSILRSAAEMVRPGGFLLYSTCTFAPEENECVLNAFLKRSDPIGSRFEIVKIKDFPGFSRGQSSWIDNISDAKAPPLERTVRLWPHHQAGEGHFIALMQRKAVYMKISTTAYPVQLKESVRKLAGQFCQDNLKEGFPINRLTTQGSYLYLVPNKLPNLDGLRVIHPGWWVGVVQKNRVEPSHALGMGLQPHQALRNAVFPLNSPQVLAYLHGESVQVDGPEGWTLFTIQEIGTGLCFPLGWGKLSQGVLKNRYPRGLRWN